MTENVKNFLKELTELSDKYGISIHGCGCCGSPWLQCENGDCFENLSMKNYNNHAYYVVDGENNVV